MDEARAALRRVFGHAAFRAPQDGVVATCAQRKDVLVVLPTGAGKSLCYQLPALAGRAGTAAVTLVVSPLLALISDQVQALRALDVDARALSSHVSQAERTAILRNLALPMPTIRILYVTPEQCAVKTTRDVIARLARFRLLRLIAVDEAHCVSQWGHDFRPDYLRLAQLRALAPDVPWMALTATATPRVRDDVVRVLGLRDAQVFEQGCIRKNLVLQVRYSQLMHDVFGDLCETIKAQETACPAGVPLCGIVYAWRKEQCVLLAQQLRVQGVVAEAYHGGMTTAEREAVQERWMRGQTNIVVATIAFGMGVDQKHVRIVVHWTIPASLEGYVQESGRAGRDGLPSLCVLYYSRDDVSERRFVLQRDRNLGTGTRKTAALASFDTLVELCERVQCRWLVIARHFEGTHASDQPCRSACDVCTSRERVATDLAQLALMNSNTIAARGGSDGHLGKDHDGQATRRKRRRPGDDDHDDDDDDDIEDTDVDDGLIYSASQPYSESRRRIRQSRTSRGNNDDDDDETNTSTALRIRSPLDRFTVASSTATSRGSTRVEGTRIVFGS